MGRWPFAARRGVALWLALLTSTFVFPAHLGSAGTTGWGTPELLATADLPIDEYGNVGTLTSPQISMRPGGSAVAMWWQADGDRSNIWAAHFIESRWTAPEAIGTGGSYDWLDVAVDPTGAALAVWANSSSSESGDIEHTVYASRFAPGAGWGVPTKVGTGWGPQVAVDSEGNALVVWTELLLDQPGFYGEKQRVWANRFVPRSGWGLPTLIEAERGGLADIAIDAWGNAVVGWWCEDECASANTHLPMVSRYTPEEGWEAPTVLEGRSHRVQVAMRSDGTAVALWALGTAPLRVSRYVPATGWETSTELVGAGAAEVVTAPYDVAAGGEGTAIAAWSFGSVTQPTWSEQDYNRQVYASRFAPEVGWQVATALSKETGAVVVRDVRSVAMDPEGDGVVVWTEHDGARTSVWASHYARGRGWGDSETISEALPAVDSWVKHYWQMSAEVAMDREGPADEPDRRGAGAEAVERRLPGGNHAGLVGKPEVVVGGEDDDLAPALHLHPGRLGAFQEVKPLIGAVADELLQLGSDPVLQRIAHGHTSRITLPAWPSLMTWIASAMRSSGKRWVMTGRGSSCPARRKRCIWCQVAYILRPVTP